MILVNLESFLFPTWRKSKRGQFTRNKFVKVEVYLSFSLTDATET